MGRRETDWQIGAALKNKPNSQGTLFRGGTKYSSDARFPRGYTPERLNEVANAVGGSYTQGKGAQANYFRDHPYVNRNQETGEREVVGRANNRPKRDLVDNIARSTVPVTDLTTAAPGRRLNFWVHATFDKTHEDNGNAGTYQPEPYGHDNRHDIHVHTEAVRGGTPIHEIGHHVSHMLNPEQHKSYSYETAHGGAEEAFADNYAEKHFRDQSGRPVYRGTYGGGQFAGHIQRGEEFWKGYHKNRDGSMAQAQADTANEEHYKRYPEDRENPDGSMDVPLIHKSWVSRDDFKHGEKPELDINPDAIHQSWR